MVRDLYPDELMEVPKYEFGVVLGIVQEILEQNDEVLTAHEEALSGFEVSMEEESK